MLPELQPGDLFLTGSSNKFSRAINSFQSWWSLDGKSEYTHAGIIVDSSGTTFEAKLKGIIYSNLDQIKNHPLLIARHEFMTSKVFEMAFLRLQYHNGVMYPFHRLFLHMIPPLARIWADKHAVCSELVGQLLYEAELLHFWRGISPDTLHEIFTYWYHYEIIYQQS